MSKVKFLLDGREIFAEEGSNLLEVAAQNGVNIPSLCHDPRLEPFGACRQCLVELEGARGAVQACGTKVREGMIVRTNTEYITDLRRLGLELLFSEHCGDCIAPCQLACPAGIDIQGFIAHIANGRPREAAQLIREKLPLPASVGRVCPRFCETDCRRNLIEGPVSICALKRYAGEVDLADGAPFIPAVKSDTGKQVAVVGGGPAGLTAAYYLALEGHRVTIFEAAPHLGGMMRYGIPEYRLPKAEMDKEIQVIANLCQNVFFNKALGRDFNIGQLKQLGFEAIFIAIGSWANQSLGLPGENMAGIYSGIYFLGEIAAQKPLTIGNKVVVIGGGNTAMDAARTSLRLGAEEVTVVYRRSRSEMPASPHEIEQADEEGVKFELLTAPVAFVGEQGQVRAIRCVKMQLGAPDSSGRRRPVPVEGSEFEVAVDMVITATGQKLEQTSLNGSPEIELNRWGNIDVDTSTMQGQRAGLFSGGDCVTGPATVVEAVAAGRKAALSIDQYLRGQVVSPEEKPFNCTHGSLDEIDPAEFSDRERIARSAMPTVSPDIRKDNFKEFELGFDEAAARKEAGRCLSCGCLDVFNCRLREYAAQVKVRPDKLGFGKLTHPVLTDHPYIIRDPNKCILCGNCVRVCQEIEGLSALGFVNRGSETVVLPSLKTPLGETRCSSCGQCITICPTGALTRRVNLTKPGPWRAKKVLSICPHCSVGCSLELNIAGNEIVGVTAPLHSDTVNQGSLCFQGSFGYAAINSPARLRDPLVMNNGSLAETGWDNAIAAAGNLLSECRDAYGLDSVAVVVSPKLTNEENYLAYKLGRMVLGTNNIFGAVPVSTGGKNTAVRKKVTATSFKDLMESDLILLIGSEIPGQYPIAAHNIKKAVKKGSKLFIISPQATAFDSLAKNTLKINENKTMRLFEAFISYVLQYGLIDTSIYMKDPTLIDNMKNQHTEDFFDISRDFWVKPAKIVEFLHMFLWAKNPVIVLNGYTIAPDVLELLQQFALITGNLNRPGSGIITLYPHGNMQGQFDLGLKNDIGDYASLVEGIGSGKIKGLLYVSDGTDLDVQLFQEGLKTVVITPLLPNDLRADVILPGTTFVETSGTFTNCEGKIQQITAGMAAPGGKENWQVLVELAMAMRYQMNYQNPADIYSKALNQMLRRLSS